MKVFIRDPNFTDFRKSLDVVTRDGTSLGNECEIINVERYYDIKRRVNTVILTVEIGPDDVVNLDEDELLPREISPKIEHERWLIACAAWNNVTPDFMRAECEKNHTRMPEGSRKAWARVFDAIRKFYEE